jgi:spermidine synthase
MSPDLVQLFALKETVYSQKTKFQRVEVIETQHFGRCLVLDGKIQSSEKDEFIYHEALVHPPMVIHPCPEKVFIAGGGEGATLREVLAYRSVGKVVMVDIDAESVDICRRFLPSWHQGSFEDKRVELLHLDAREYLKKAPEKFDVIILDLTDPLKGSPSCLLYTQQFYQLAQERLTPKGMISVQANSCSLGESRIFVAIINTLRSALPSVFPYQTFIPSFGSLWGFALAGEELAEPLSLSCQEIDSCITSRITKKLNFYDGLTHQGMFSLPKHLREEIGQERRIITDENPIFPS